MTPKSPMRRVADMAILTGITTATATLPLNVNAGDEGALYERTIEVDGCAISAPGALPAKDRAKFQFSSVRKSGTDGPVEIGLYVAVAGTAQPSSRVMGSREAVWAGKISIGCVNGTHSPTVALPADLQQAIAGLPAESTLFFAPMTLADYATLPPRVRYMKAVSALQGMKTWIEARLRVN